MMTTEYDDQTLLAYLDGELARESDYAAIERALNTDAHLQARLQALVDSADQLKGAFRGVMQAPVPPRLIDAVWNAPWSPVHAQAPARQPSAPMHRPAQQPQRWWSGWLAWPQRPWPAAALASVAWAAVALAVWPVMRDHQAQPAAHWAAAGQVVQDGRVLAVLQAAPSGLAVPIQGSTFEVLATLEPEPGRYCRELQETRQETGPQPGRLTTAAVVCAGAEGAWSVEFAAQHLQPEGAFQTASDALHQAVERHLQTYAQSEPLSDEAEAGLIRGGWSPP